MSGLQGIFTTRTRIEPVEWDNQRKDWVRPPLDRQVLKELSRRSTMNGVLRILWFVALLGGAAVITRVLFDINPWFAIPGMYAYWFLYGFWVALAHELQHQTVFAKRETWLNEVVFSVIMTMLWNSPTYSRVSHKLHHRYTMVRGYDPETDWPEVITTKWLRGHLAAQFLRLLILPAVYDMFRDAWVQIKRIAGRKDWMMRDHCTDEQIRVIRVESLQILLTHIAIVAVAVLLGRWELLLFVTIAWHMGAPMERLWHDTKHIARPYNVKDHRLNTRSIKVSWFVKTFFWGLDDHVDHHLYPAIPSRNLPKLHKILGPSLPHPDNVFGCWAEMFEIAKKKTDDPANEYLSAPDAVPADRHDNASET